MEIQQLRYFMEIARQKSVSKAAEKLYISRQTVSAAISQLENELGYPLLVRKKQGIELTNGGAEFLYRIEGLFGDFDQLKADMKGYAEQYKLSVKIGLVTGIQYPYVEVLERWKENNSQYQVELIFCGGKDSTEKLKTGELNFVFTMMPCVGSSYFLSQVVASYPLYVAVHEDNPLSKKTEICHKDLIGQTMISTTLGYEQWEYSGEKWMPVNVDADVIMTEDFSYMFSLLCHNKGIMLCEKNNVLENMRNIHLIPLEDKSYAYPYFLRISNHTLKNRDYDMVVRSLERFLKHELA